MAVVVDKDASELEKISCLMIMIKIWISTSCLKLALVGNYPTPDSTAWSVIRDVLSVFKMLKTDLNTNQIRAGETVKSAFNGHHDGWSVRRNRDKI